MYVGSLVFAQLMCLLPLHAFHRCVQRYQGHRNVKSFSCLDQFLVMAFAQLTFRESLRDIEACLSAVPSKLYHMGIRSPVSRSTLADANEARDWRIFADFAQVLIGIARRLYRHESFGLQLDETVYALDATTIDLCLALFPWAKFRQHKGAVKLHTLLDLRGNIPSFIHITDGKVHDINVLDVLIPEPGSFYVMDRGYLDFARLYGLTQNQAYFVVRSKENLKFRRLYSHPVDKSTGLRCDQRIVVTGPLTSQLYSEKLRRVGYVDATTQKRFSFLSNNFVLPALTITQLYKCRWQVELFFDRVAFRTPLYVIAFQGLVDSNYLFAGLLMNSSSPDRQQHLPCAESKEHLRMLV